MSIFDIFKKKSTTTSTTTTPTSRDINVTDFSTGESVVKTTTTTGGGGRSNVYKTYSPTGAGVSPARQETLVSATKQQEQATQQQQLTQQQRFAAAQQEQTQNQTPIQSQQKQIQQQIIPKNQTQQYYSDPYLRRTLPAGQRIKLAYESVPAKPFSVRGGLRAGIEIVDIYITQPIQNAFNIGDSFLTQPVSTKGAEDAALGLFFLAPTTATTAQIERQVAETAKVKIIGVSQQQSGGKVTTQAAFRASRAGKTVQGVVQTTSKPLASTESRQIIAAGSKGTTFRYGLEVPTGRLLIKQGTTFKAVELAGVNNAGGLTFSRGVGLLQQGTQQIPFKSVSVSKQFGDFIRQIGASSTSQGNSFSTGAFKIASSSKTDFIISSGGGNIPSSTLKIASATALKSAVRASVNIPPTPPLNILPTVSASPIRQSQKTETVIAARQVPTQIIEQPQTPIIRTAPRVSPRIASTSSSALKSLTTQVTRQEESTGQLPRTTQITNQSQRGRQSLLQLQFLQLRQRQTRITPSPNLNINPRTKPIPFFNFRKVTPKIKTSTKPIKVYVKEKGAFKFKGAFSTAKLATERGVDITAKTINRSFKIVGANVGIPQGYRRSRAKGQKNVLVELSTTSLSQLGEQFSIQTARKRRKKR